MTILLFAQLREVMGSSALELDIKALTVSELLEHLAECYPQMPLQHVMVAVNEELAGSDDLIQPGDTVALLPPVSGG